MQRYAERSHRSADVSPKTIVVRPHRFVYIVSMADVGASQVKELALQVGFDLCGICAPDPIPEAQSRYIRWLEHGYHAEMAYLARDPQRRTDPREVMPSVRSIIMLGLNYFQSKGKKSRRATGGSPAMPGGGTITRSQKA
jgi:epoxyqueuosine reductase QueG